MTKIYEGRISTDGPTVLVWKHSGRARSFTELPLRYPECRHSPEGFAWGYGGSGPGQLAYALLRNMGYSKAEAARLHHYLKDVLTSRLPQDEPWTMSENVLAMFVWKAKRLAKQEDVLGI